MGYVVLHLEKAKGTDSAMSSHIERTVKPKNADETKTHLNKELIEFPEGVKNRTQAIQYRLDNAKLKRKIASNQVRAIRILLSGSPEDMKRIEESGRMDEWCKDNLDWLKYTYGKENLVSAVLHLDETTPHIHATVIPIVTGQSRKAKLKEKGQEQKITGKKKYKTKDPNTARLCVDDVMTRVKLKEYQNTYAEKMQVYGLERGIDGSEARHITQPQYYRELYQKNKTIQEDIALLLQQKEEEQKKLEELKSQVKKQEVVKSAKSAILGIFSNSEKDKLENENRELKDKIDNLDRELIKTRSDNYTKINQMEVQMKNDKSTVEKLNEYFPKVSEGIRIIRLCEVIGLATDYIKRLLSGKSLTINKGTLYSPEHKQKFDAKDTTIAISTNPKDEKKYQLTANNIEISDWFKLKYKEFQQSIGINIKQRNKTDNSIKM
ncbi:MAG: MobV family relaxase [Dysgonomonas sp.]|nr:MobV family relaxase [Dysgonomonas sp.]